MKKHLRSICLLLSFVFGSPVHSQAPKTPEAQTKRPNAPAQPDDVVRINVNLVQVDVTVTDDKGRQVTDLQPEDFEVFEQGRAQHITHFSYVTPSSTQAAAKTPDAVPLTVAGKNGKEKTVLVAAPLPPVLLRPEQVRRTVALVVDDLGLSHESSARVRQALSKFVDEQIQPGDLVAIIRTGAGMGALQQFTTDKRLLRAAIDRIRYNLGSRGEISTFAPIGGEGIAVQLNDDSLALRYGGGQDRTTDGRGPASTMLQPGREIDQFREELFSVGTLGALNFVVRGLKDLPGRKSVVLFSDGFKLYTEDPGNRRILDNLKRLTDLANRASVVFYTIDPRGLQYLGISAADNLNYALGTFNPAKEKPLDPNNLSLDEFNRLGGDAGADSYAKRQAMKPVDQFFRNTDNIEQALTSRRNDFFETQHGLSYLASQTGGFLVKNNNDINGAIRRVLNDQNGFYLLGYRPDDANLKDNNGGQLFHQITVKVKRPGVQVRTRNGYLGFTEEQTRRPLRRTAGEQLFAALTSPFNSGDIALRMTALFGYDQQRGPFMQSLVHINAPDLIFKEKPNGSREAVIDVMAVTFGDNGKVIDQDDRAYAIQVGAREFQRALQEGLVYIVTLPIKKPGAYQLRIAVRDHTSEKVGSANQFIDVPDVKKGRLSLSGITLSGVNPMTSSKTSAPTSSLTSTAANETANLDRTDPRASPANRHLRAGMILNYAYFIYNAQIDKASHLPKVATQVRLFRDGQMIFAGQLSEYSGTVAPDSRQLVAGGSFRLGSDLSPGEYVLQVVVVDHLAGNGRQVTTQWIDFDVD